MHASRLPALVLAALGASIALELVAPTARAADTAAAVAQGRDLYQQYCESCHGPDMVTSSKLVFDLRQFPKSEPERFRNAVLNGKGGMPAWRDQLSPEDVASLWAYVQSGQAR